MLFCEHCRADKEYECKVVKCKHEIRGVEYEFDVTKYFCKECGCKIIPQGLLDYNVKEIDQQYRKIEDLVSIEEIILLQECYDENERCMHGLDAKSMEHYVHGVVPTKEVSNVMRKLVNDRIHEHADLCKKS